MASEPVVTVSEGKLRGRVCSSVKGNAFYSYQGIPYAKPPLGNLRFKPPQPCDTWEGVRDAQKEGPICTQNEFLTKRVEGSEDCLYLNVYTTQPPGESNRKDPVMVWIHGGAYMHGSGNSSRHGPERLMDYGVILVTLNYRVGVFGFLSTEDEVCPGNNGMKDQVLALKWVKRNIAAFGGNTDNITIFGESAGGSSVHLHMLSPMSKGLFHQAISQSGTALCSWAVKGHAREKAFKLGEFLGFKAKSSQELIDFFRTLEASKFPENTPKFRENKHITILPFSPVVELKTRKDEAAFLPRHPMEILRSGKFNHVPWIAGVNSDEGALLSATFILDPEYLKKMDEEFERLAPIHFLYEDNTEKSKEISRRIKEYYFHNKPLEPELLDRFLELDSDSKFIYGTVKAAQLHKEKSSSPVFMYNFSYEGQNSMLKVLGIHNRKGATHTDDMVYLFTSKLFPVMNDSDKKTADRILTLWTNFAKHGNPTPEASEIVPVIWEPVSNDMSYLDIGTELRMKKKLLGEKYDFWKSLDELIEQDVFQAEI